MDEHLLQSQLEAYARSGLYPLHMPGHKRRVCPAPGLAAAWDVTEVPGTDDLHDAHGILAAAMARTAALYGARRTWYLVNGSTCGLLAGIRALAPAGSEIIAARNCHKAVFHAIELGALRVHWLVPAADEAFGVFGSVTPAQVQQALNACPAARCVVLGYDWPGNIRELDNALAFAGALCEEGLIEVSDLPEHLGRTPLPEPVNAREAELRAVLSACDGNVSEAARRLGIDRTTLHRQMRRFNIGKLH